jgi:hypothetical protein
MVTEQFDPDTKGLIPSLQVIKSEDETFLWKQKGPLKPPKNAPSD